MVSATKVRFVYSLAGINGPQNDADLLPHMIERAHILNAFHDNGGSYIFVTHAAKTKRSPARRSKKRSQKV